MTRTMPVVRSVTCRLTASEPIQFGSAMSDA